MKKGKFLSSLLLAVVLFVNAFSAQVPAEDAGYEEGYEEDYGETESQTEHPAAYYEEIQSNNISGWPQGPAVESDAAIVMDADTGAVLYAKDVEQQLYPASITKIMTTLIALENGNLDDIVKFSEFAVYSIEPGSSHLGMQEGEELTLEQCLYGIMLASANEISNAVAEHIGGNITNFVQMMNDKAAELGCTNTHFSNAHGLQEEDHYVCARDMALIMQAAVQNEKFCEIISTVEYHFPKTNLVDEERYFINHHKMISEEGMLYDGCIGGKPGFTDEAWNTLVTYAQRGKQRLICVVLRAPGLYVAYDNTRILLDYGFDEFRNKQIDNVNSQDMEIAGIEDEAELAKIRQADIGQPPFSIVGSALVTLPSGVKASALHKVMDFNTSKLSYYYEDQLMASVPFLYTGEWETEKQTEEASEMAASDLEKETAAETSALVKTTNENVGNGLRLPGFLKSIFNGIAFLYDKMDVFIDENTVVAAIIGAVLLLVFIPLLFLAVNRHRKYQHILELRKQDLEVQRQLEEEIEKKSAAQVEAELRTRELRQQLEEEKRRWQRERKAAESEEETDADAYLEKELSIVETQEGEQEDTQGSRTAGESQEPETEQVQTAGSPDEEYIEVPVEDGIDPLD